MTQFFHNPAGNRMGRPRIGHQLTKQGAQQEDRQELDRVIAQRLHEGFGVDRQVQRDLAREQYRQGGHQRCKQQHGDAPIGQVHQ